MIDERERREEEELYTWKKLGYGGWGRAGIYDDTCGYVYVWTPFFGLVYESPCILGLRLSAYV